MSQVRQAAGEAEREESRGDRGHTPRLPEPHTCTVLKWESEYMKVRTGWRAHTRTHARTNASFLPSPIGPVPPAPCAAHADISIQERPLDTPPTPLLSRTHAHTHTSITYQERHTGPWLPITNLIGGDEQPPITTPLLPFPS